MTRLLYRIYKSEDAEGMLTNMVGVHPVRWHDVTLGMVDEPTLVAVEDEEAERHARIGAVTEAGEWDAEMWRYAADTLATVPLLDGLVGKCRAIAAALEAEEKNE